MDIHMNIYKKYYFYISVTYSVVAKLLSMQMSTFQKFYLILSFTFLM